MNFLTCELVENTGERILQILNVIHVAKTYKMKPVLKYQPDTEKLLHVFFNDVDIMSMTDFDEISFERTCCEDKINSNNNTIIIGVPKKIYQSKKELQEIIYSCEDYMYKAYEMYTSIKKEFNDENDDNYVVCYIENIEDYEIIKNKCKSLEKHIVVFSEITNVNKKHFEKNVFIVDSIDEYASLILFSLFPHMIFQKSKVSLVASCVNNNPNKTINQL